MLSLIAILATFGIVSSTPFEKASMVNAMAVSNDTIYVGGFSTKTIQRYTAKNGRLKYLDQSEPFALSTRIVKEIEIGGDYLYFCTRSNGFGMGVDRKHPEYISPFENTIGFEDIDTVGDVKFELVADPCPSRFAKSLRLVKSKGNSRCVYTHAVPEVSNSAEFLLWIKVPQSPSGPVTIPLIKNVLALSLDKSGALGLEVLGSRTKGAFKPGPDWTNVMVSVKDGEASLSVRAPECPEAWTQVCSAPAGEFRYNSISLGIEGRGAAEIQFDEYAYAAKDLEKKSHINGSLVVMDRRTMKVVNKYLLDLRCLSLLRDGNTLYLGMIGGINVYDLSDPASPKLKSTFRDSDGRFWTYPSRSKATFSYKVPGEEFQRISLMTIPDGRKILAGGNDVRGLTLVDVTDPAAPKLFKHFDTIPTVPVSASGKSKDSKKYIEWDVICDYPYIYTTVASLHSLVHNQYYNGANTPESWTPDIYGLKVYDISNPDAVRDTLIRVPSDYYPTHLSKEADSAPNQMTRIGDRIYTGMGDKGVAVFKADGFRSSFEREIEFPATNRIRYTSALGDRLLTGGGAVFGPWTECNIFLLDVR